MAGLTKKELEAQIAVLKKQAEEQEKLSSSLDAYLEGLRKVKLLSETVARNKKIEGEIQQKMNEAYLAGNIQGAKDEFDKLNLLKEQTKELEEQGKKLVNNLKEVNKLNLVMAKSGASLVKGIAGLPGIIEKGYQKIKGFGFFDMDKAVKQSALQMGLVSQSAKKFSDDIRIAAKDSNLIGVSMQDLAKMQSDYADELGRNVMLNESGLKAISEIAAATSLGVEGSAKMAADMEKQGFSAERTNEYVERTLNNSTKMGLNGSKVIKNVQQNIKLLNKYNFKDGIKGLTKMAEISAKLGIDMNAVSGMADKLFDIEGAVEMSSQLQVLGGAWSKLADPFHLMYMARNDMAGLTEEIGKAAESSVTFNKENHDFEISSMEMHRLRKIAEQTGIAYDDLATAGKNAAKFTKIKSQVGFRLNKDAKEFLTNTAKLDENGRASIEVMVDGKRTKKFVNELKAFEVEKLMGEDKKLRERAKESQTFDDALTNFIASFKISFLPIIDGMNEKLVPKLENLAKWLTNSGWIDRIEVFARKVGELIGTIGGFIIDNPIESAIILATAKLLGSTAGWILNGLSLAKGFMVGTKFFGGGGVGRGGGGAVAAGGAARAPILKKDGTPDKRFSSNRQSVGASPAPVTRTQRMLGQGGKVGAGSMGSLALGAGLGVAGLGMDYGRSQMDDPDSGWGKTLGIGASAAKYAGMGALLGPWGALAGGVLGLGIGAYDEIFSDEAKARDSERNKKNSIASMGDGIVFNAKDKFMKMNDGSMIAGTNVNGNKDLAKELSGQSSKVLKIEFGEIHFKFDELKVTSPGSPGLAVNIMKDPTLIRDLTRMIHIETEKAFKGGKIGG